MNVVCPACRGELEESAADATCLECRRVYPRVGESYALIPARTSQHDSQQRYFDDEFSGFSPYVVENWRASFLERIFAALDLEPGDRYLDIGVGGSGATVIEAARRGVESYGCDLSPTGIDQASRLAASEGVTEHASFAVASAEALPYPDASFDSVSAVALLEHLDDDGLAVSEIARVTAPGGRVWITVPNAYRYMLPPLWPVYWLHDRRIGHKRHYTHGELARLFSASGFEQVTVQHSAHPVKLLQVGLTLLAPSTRRPDSSLWWRLERLDRRRAGRAFGALQLSALFRKRALALSEGS